MSEHNAPWVVSNCGNPEHGPGWKCHRVTDSTGTILLRNVTRSVAEAYAQIPALHAAVAAAREEGRREGFEKAREMALGEVAEEIRHDTEAKVAAQARGDDRAAISFSARVVAAESIGEGIRAMRDGADVCRCGKPRDQHDANGLRVTVGQVPVCAGFVAVSP